MKTRQIVFAVLGSIFKVAATIVIVYFVYQAAMLAYDYGYRVFTEPAIAEKGQGIEITVDITNKSERQVGQLLEDKGLIRDGDLFFVQILLSEYKGKLLPGSYVLSTEMAPKQMMEIMSTEPAKDAEGEDTE